MATKAMPEPDAWAATDEDGKVEALGFNQSRTRFDTPLITTVKAEAYAAARVREALEQIIASLEREIEVARRHSAHAAVLALADQSRYARALLPRP